MATQFKHLDFPHPTAARPNIRIAFENGPAVVAVNRALTDAPSGDATLDELNSGAPLRTLLVRRNAILEQLDADDTLTDAEQGERIAALHALEMAIIKAPAGTPDDAIVKLIAVAQVSAEGHVLDDVEAAQAIAEARKHFGVGYVGDHHDLADASVDTGTLDEPAGQGGIAVAPWLGRAPRLDASPDSLAAAFDAADGPIALPALPPGLSGTMAGFVNGYRTAFYSTAETAGDEVTAAADLVRLRPATTVADLAAKLLVAIHHAHPTAAPDGALAIDPTDFECTQAGEMMLSVLTDALRLAGNAASATPGSPSVTDITYAATPTGNPTFDTAEVLYTSYRAFERAFPDTNNDASLEDALGEACDRTDAALLAMLAVPVTDNWRAARKLTLAFERYDIARSGLLPGEVADQLIAAVAVTALNADPVAGTADRRAWHEALAPFVAAKTAERDYDEATYLPALARSSADGTEIPAEIDQESDRRLNRRFGTEDAVMSTPAPDAGAFAFKFLLAYAEGRDANGWKDQLVEEALRFAPHFPREATRA